MPTIRAPRHGSMQIWPRKRAKTQNVRIRYWTPVSEVKPTGFAGYKAGMTHIIVTDHKKTSLTKGMDVSIPVTVVECPPMKIAGFRAYKKIDSKIVAYSEIISQKVDKELSRTLQLSKKKETDKKLAEIEKNTEALSDIKLLVYTQPKLTGIGKKRPEVFEMPIGGKMADKLKYAKEHMGAEFTVADIFKEGICIDVHSVTKGKGYQGPVKRFGIAIRQHKSEKTKRGPGSVGPWHPHHGNYRVSHAGQMGYHARMEKNKQIMMISNDAAKINPQGGFLHYGTVRGTYILLKGSVGGAAKRFVKMTFAQRKNKKILEEPMAIQYISTASKQG